MAYRPQQWDRFLRYDYPGNVRELENLVERAIALEAGTQLSAENLPAQRGSQPASELQVDLDENGVDLEQAVARSRTSAYHGQHSGAPMASAKRRQNS